MKILYYDLETTGTNPGKNGIHQISGEIVINGVSREKFDFRVRPNPKALIEDEALQVAGVTREQILAYPPMEEIYKQFLSMIGRYVSKYDKNDKFFLAGYNNAAFDNQFLRVPVEEESLHDALYDIHLTRQVYDIVTKRNVLF